MKLVKKALACMLAVVCLLSSGITQTLAVTIGGTNYSHPVNVENSTVWYNEDRGSRQIGGDAHTYNLIQRYEADKSANNFYAGRGGKIKINGAALNQNLWKKNKDSGAWQNNATNYAWLAQNGAGSTLNNSVNGKVYLSNNEYNSKNKAFAVVGKIGNNPTGKRYSINSDTFDLDDPLLQMTPVYQETTGKAGFWLQRNKMNVKFDGISEGEMKNMPVTVRGSSVPSGQNTGNFAAASSGSVRRTMTYGGKLEGSANVNPSSAEEQVYNYLSCETRAKEKTLAFSNLSYGTWGADIKNNTNSDYTLQMKVITRKGFIYANNTSGAGNYYDDNSATKTYDFPRGTTLSLPAAQMIADGYINYTLKLIPKAPNRATVNVLGLDETERALLWTSLESQTVAGGNKTELFFENSKVWNNLSTGTYNTILTSLSSNDYDVKMTVDYRSSSKGEVQTVEKTFRLNGVTVGGGSADLSKYVSDKLKLDDGGMVNYTFEFYKDVSARRIEVNFNGMDPFDFSDTVAENPWTVRSAASESGAYGKIPATPWINNTRSAAMNLKNSGSNDFYQLDFSAANQSRYCIESIRCTVYDAASGAVIRTYDDVSYPSGTLIAQTTKLPYNLNADNKKMSLRGVAQNGIQIANGQVAVFDVNVKQTGIFALGAIKTTFHPDANVAESNADGRSVALCDATEVNSSNPKGIVAIGKLKNGQYNFGTYPSGRQYTVRFLDYDSVGYAVTPGAGSSPSINPLTIFGWTAHFYADCAPIQLSIEGGAGVTAAEKAGVPIDVLTFDETEQTFTKVTTLTTNSAGTVSYQPEELGQQYYFSPSSAPAHCFFPRSTVSSERYTGAGQTVTLPMEKMQAVELNVTRDAGVSEPVSGKKIDVLEGTLTNSDAVDNGAEPVYRYRLLETVTTGANGKVLYYPSTTKQILKFVPQPLGNANLAFDPASLQIWYTGSGQSLTFHMYDRFQPLTIRCTDFTERVTSFQANVQVSEFVPDESGKDYVVMVNGSPTTIRGVFEEIDMVMLSDWRYTDAGNAQHFTEYTPRGEGIFLFRFLTEFAQDGETEYSLTPDQVLKVYTGKPGDVDFELRESTDKKLLTLQFQNTEKIPVEGITGVLAADNGNMYYVSSNAQGESAVAGVSDGLYTFYPYMTPGRMKPVQVAMRLYCPPMGMDDVYEEKEIASFEEYAFQVHAGFFELEGMNLIITYTLEEEPPNDNVDITFRQPNAAYRKGTQVVSTFILTNNTDKAYTPDSPLTVKANFYHGAGTMQIGVKTDVILPPGGSQIVYFKWTVPASANAGNCRIEATVAPSDGAPMAGGNLHVTANVPVIEKEILNTPPTVFDTTTGKFFQYKKPTADKEYHNVTKWEEWAWENGNYVKKSYDARLSTQELTVWPDETNPSSSYDPLKKEYTMRSGYAIKLRYRPKVDAAAPVSAVTGVQWAQAFFPEFHFAAGVKQVKTLELTAPGLYNFFVDRNSTYKPGEKGDGRKHFTPMYFPDKPYQVQTLASDYWTPVGMLSYLDNTNEIQIDGSLYDDYYTSSGGSSAGDVEVQG